VDDGFASFFLDLDVLSEFFAVLFLLELLPGPIDLDVLLVRCDNFRLDLVSSFSFHLLLLDSSDVLVSLSMGSDLGDNLGGLPLVLFQETLGLLNSNFTEWLNFNLLLVFFAHFLNLFKKNNNSN